MSCRRPPAAPSARERTERAVMLSGLVLVAALAWAWLLLVPSHAGWGAALLPVGAYTTAGVPVFAFAMWLAMIAAMMLPVVLPWVAVLAGMTGPPASAPRRVAGFLTGYLAVWSAFSAGAAGLQTSLRHLVSVGVLSTILGGLGLVVAGAYQFTPLKRACLKHCRSPLGFLLSSWRDGPSAGVRLGVHHGLFCLGCCWALMALMLVVGTASLLWMAMLTALMVAEQVGPRGLAVGRAAGVLLGAWGLVVLGQAV